MCRKSWSRALAFESLVARQCMAADVAMVEVAAEVSQVQSASVQDQQPVSNHNDCSSMDACTVDSYFSEFGLGAENHQPLPSSEKFFHPDTGVQNDYDGNGRPDDLPDDIPYELIPSKGEGEPPVTTIIITESVFVPICCSNTTVNTSTVSVNVTNNVVNNTSFTVVSGGGSTVVNNYYSQGELQEEPFKKGGLDPELQPVPEEPKMEDKKPEEAKPQAPKPEKAPCLPPKMECPKPYVPCPPIEVCPPEFFYPSAPVFEGGEFGKSQLFVAPVAAAAIFALPITTLDREDRRRNQSYTAV